MILKFNQFTMNEEYGLSSDRTEQQFLIKEIVRNINPEFTVLFNGLSVQITANNNINRSLDGKHSQRLDIHKTLDCIEQLIQVEKELIEGGIMPNQFSQFDIEHSFFRISFAINP